MTKHLKLRLNDLREVFALFVSLIYNPERDAEEKRLRVQTERARLIGDLAQHRDNYDYFTARAVKTDPWEDHWGFASVRQKQIDALQDIAATEAKLRALPADEFATVTGATDFTPEVTSPALVTVTETTPAAAAA